MALVTLQTIFQDAFPAYEQSHALPAHVRRAAHAIMQCRTAALGGHVQACPDGHMARIWYNSCRHRSCPQCAYILAEAQNGTPEVLLLATGSEVALCIAAYAQLTAEGIQARVVSMPSWEIFEYYCRQHPEYREHVLPAAVTARVSVEQASTLGWARYVGSTGRTIGMETFGASAPLKELQRKFGFTPESIVTAAKEQVAQGR
jgi:transketolase